MVDVYFILMSTNQTKGNKDNPKIIQYIDILAYKIQ